MPRLLLSLALFAFALTAMPAAASAGQGSFTPLGLKLGFARGLPEAPEHAMKAEQALRSAGTPFAGAIGLQVAPVTLPGLWLEGEALNRRVDVGNGFADTQLTFVNLSYQPDLGKITPFATIGGGLARRDGRITDSAGFMSHESGDPATSFAWQFGGGLQYSASEDLAVTGSYRYLSGGDPGLRQEGDLNDHELWLRADYDIPVRRNLEPLKGSRRRD